MAIRDLAGTGALQDALSTTNSQLGDTNSQLATTNTHLAAVLSELQETNGQRLELLATELHSLNDKVDRLLERLQGS
jgi:chromosome segregation ATPase